MPQSVQQVYNHGAFAVGRGRVAGEMREIPVVSVGCAACLDGGVEGDITNQVSRPKNDDNIRKLGGFVGGVHRSSLPQKASRRKTPLESSWRSNVNGNRCAWPKESDIGCAVRP